ncbi:autophagy-related protein 18h [Nicotiana attenuata]|uniref:Autophagy-related protein 18h n=1 Tax=Nicotiana attenuata TaxID=49451 RepID=A0A314KYK8_NICAT|nr:autophagy-related protein 18h [Nicotiana attenuata]
MFLTAKRQKGCHLYSAHHKGARDNSLLIRSYVDKWLDTGQVLWACFDMGELCVSSLLRQVQLIGYPHGFQVLDIATASSRCKLRSRHVDPVNSLQMQHFPVTSNGCKGFRPSRLLLLLIASDDMVDSTPARSERHDFIAPGANFFVVTIRITTDLYVWDLGISSAFLALTGGIENVAALILLGCTGKFCFIAYFNSKTRVWDPGQPWCVNSYILHSDLALSVTSLPNFTHFYVVDWTCVRSQTPLDFALPSSYSYDDTNKSFLPCSLKIASFLHVADCSGELLLAKGDTMLLRNIIFQSTQVAILGDMLELGATEFTFNELMLQFCCDTRFNVAAPVETRFTTAAENINCAEEIKLLCLNDDHCPSSEIINFLNSDDDILVKVSCQRQRGMSWALVKCTFP